MAEETFYPYENPYLIGHEAEEQLFLSAYNAQALHHGWLITGDEGIGKATLAYKIARFLLAAEAGKIYNSLDIPTNSPIFAQVAQKSHPDFRVLERDYTETDKKKLIKAINQGETVDEEMKQGLKRSAVIKVEDVRGVVEFLLKKSFNDSWRVVLVDSADDLNPSSANALLKILEEPPHKSILLLVSHNPGRLLPTIRSRCARLSLNPLQTTQVASLLRRYKPELGESEVQGLAKIAGGSIGRAIRYADNDALEMYENIKAIRMESMTTTASDIEALIKREIAVGFRPDMVIIDYFECLAPERIQYSKADTWEKEGITIRKLEKMTNKYNIAIWIPVQGNRESIGLDKVGLAQGGGSIKKTQAAHVVITFAQTDDQKTQGRMNIFLAKLRSGKITRNQFYNVAFNNGTCKFDMSNIDADTSAIENANDMERDMEIAAAKARAEAKNMLSK